MNLSMYDVLKWIADKNNLFLLITVLTSFSSLLFSFEWIQNTYHLNFKNNKSKFKKIQIFQILKIFITVFLLIIIFYKHLHFTLNSQFNLLILILIFTIWIAELFTFIQFNGIYNGGSDTMYMILWHSLFLSFLFSKKIGMLFLTIMLVFSYFKAGLSKLKHISWRNGTAINFFISKPYTTTNFKKYFNYPNFNFILSYLIIIWEISIIGITFFPNNIKLIYFFIATIFHLMIFLQFGLNRFFWTWIPAWLSIFII